MAKKWYPVIDYITCIECGSCVDKCSHGVYDTSKKPVPLVKSSENCIDHCHGCGNICPVGAITYIGDDTGWTPPNGEQTEKEVSCGCGCDSNTNNKKVLIEYLYLDLKTCERCVGTEEILTSVVDTITPALNLAGFEIEYKKIEVATVELANKHQFLSSPTICVNGQDICKTVEENSCACCSDISNSAVDCRVFTYNGETSEVPSKEMLAEAILHSIFTPFDATCVCGKYTLPTNLKLFFDGKMAKSKCSCGGDC